jgi:Casein kinase II, beta subunit
MGVDTVKIFCPKCQNVYHPSPIRHRNSYGTSTNSSSAIDGAAFGTTFAHLFLMTFNNLVPDGLSEESAYVPRVFGFRVHPSARQRSANSSITSAAAVGNAATSLLSAGAAKKPSNVTTTVPGVGTGNGATMENYNDDRNKLGDNAVASKPTVASAEGKGKRTKRGKSKSEDSGGSSRRKSRNGGDNDESASSRTKRQKRP